MEVLLRTQNSCLFVIRSLVLPLYFGHITQRMPLTYLKVFVRALAILARNTEYKLKHLI